MRRRLRTDGALGPSEGPVGSVERVLRFVLVERIAHWLYALLFIICLVSGLLMWIPSTRDWMGGARHGVAQRHAATGFAMVTVPLLVVLVIDRRRLVADLREVDSWTADDRRWFWAALRGGLVRRKAMPPQGRFNAGQKANAVVVAVMALGFAVTGALLLGKAGLPAWLVSRALWLHEFLAIAGMLLLVGHISQVLLTTHGRESLRSMITGRFREELARERHATWWAKVVDENRPEGGDG